MHTQFRQTLDQFFRPIRLGQRDTQIDDNGRLPTDKCAWPYITFACVPFDLGDDSLGLVPFAVKQFEFLANLHAHDPDSVLRLRIRQSDRASTCWQIGNKVATRHDRRGKT